MPESNTRAVLLISVKNWLTYDRCALLFFCTKILSKDPYLKFFIRRVLNLYCERFCSFSRYATRCVVTTYFLLSLQCDDGTKAVNNAVEVLEKQWTRTKDSKRALHSVAQKE